MTAPEALRDWLEMWRSSGRGFDEAWTLSLHRASAGYAESWQTIFTEQREVWRRAYELADPLAWESAFADEWADRVAVADVEHPCAHCDEPIPEERLAHRAEFCSERCRQAAKYVRERERLRTRPITRSDGRLNGRSESPSDVPRAFEVNLSLTSETGAR
jgi:predicted nucleic acid-binding Zn ribbon protein